MSYILQATAIGVTPVTTASFTVQAPPAPPVLRTSSPTNRERERGDHAEDQQERQAGRQAYADRLPVHLQYRNELVHHQRLNDLSGADLRSRPRAGGERNKKPAHYQADRWLLAETHVEHYGAGADRHADVHDVQERRPDHPDRHGNQQRGRHLAGRQQRRLHHLPGGRSITLA